MKRVAGTISSLALAAALFGGATAAAAQDCQRSARFAPQWARLDAARTWRGGFAQPDGGGITRKRGNKSYNQLLLDYPPQRAELLALLDEFSARLDDPKPSNAREANCGLRETLSEVMAGETMLGNQKLLQGLRSRYPKANEFDPDQKTFLSQADASFRSALELAADHVRQGPERFRARGNVNPDPAFAFFTENTPPAPNTQGEVIEDDYFRFTELILRAGLAGNSLGKRTFFLGNDTPVERANASAIFKRTAQTVYLSGALLAAAQSPRDFQTNRGNEVKREVSDAQQTFDDIRAGFNPLTLRGDFVPFQPTDNLLSGLRNLVVSAKASEESARILNRQYDEDQTALTQELRRQTEAYINQLDILLGIIVDPGESSCDPPAQKNCDLTIPKHREKVLALTRDPAYLCGPQAAIDPLDCSANAEQGACDATICANYRAYVGAVIDLREAQRALFNFSEQIRIEEERSGAVTRIVQDSALSLGLLDIFQGLAEAASPDIGTDGVLTFSTSAGTAGIFNFGRTMLEAGKEIQLEQTASTATIENLKLEAFTQAEAVKRAKLAVIEEHTNYTASIGDLVRFIRNAVGSREELAQAYFTNPAYRLQLEKAQQDSDVALETAMVGAYEATKALEYEWSERLSNPVRRRDNNPPELIGGASKFNAIVRAESVFAVASAGSPGSPSPTLQTYVEALQQWDIKMRQLRGPLRQEGSTVRLSLKKDIFAYDSADEVFNRLAFRNRIAKSRVKGQNPQQDDLVLEFPFQIGDQRLLPAVANLKILSLGVNLKTVPGRSLRKVASPNPPLVDLVMLDQAVVRTFFADFPSNDDFISLKLAGARNFRQSQFAALAVEATIDGAGTVAPNVQLANRSPAVSRWQLRIQGDSSINDTLQLDNLDDIEIVLTYTSGYPETFKFPEFRD